MESKKKPLTNSEKQARFRKKQKYKKERAFYIIEELIEVQNDLFTVNYKIKEKLKEIKELL